MADFEEQKEVARMVQQESPSKAEAEDSNSSGSESIPLQLKLPNKKTIYDPGEPRRVNTRAKHHANLGRRPAVKSKVVKKD